MTAQTKRPATRELLIEALRTHGPSTPARLEELTGRSRTGIQNALSQHAGRTFHKQAPGVWGLAPRVAASVNGAPQSNGAPQANGSSLSDVRPPKDIPLQHLLDAKRLVESCGGLTAARSALTSVEILQFGHRNCTPMIPEQPK